MLTFAIEGRKRVKDQVMRIDTTYPTVHFTYTDASGQSRAVKTLEEETYPHYYNKAVGDPEGVVPQAESIELDFQEVKVNQAFAGPTVKEQHQIFQENQRGVSYDSLFGHYLRGASRIVVTDPYIRLFYQVRNFMEFLETVLKYKPIEDEVAVHLITTEDDCKGEQQKENFEKMKNSCDTAGIAFTWEFDETGTMHTRP